jgi:hypothetical protein
MNTLSYVGDLLAIAVACPELTRKRPPLEYVQDTALLATTLISCSPVALREVQFIASPRLMMFLNR